MAEQQQPNALAAAFPTPPPFWKHFTTANIDRMTNLRAEKSDAFEIDTSKAASIHIFDLPPELRFLNPPAPPTNGVYRCFGDTYDLNEGLPSLEEQGIQQLYTPPITPATTGKHSDRALILKRIAKSLLLNFLELVGIMSVSPEQYAEKIQDLRTLFINFHHLLNEYRPHQARESLILMMQDQLDRSRSETEGIMKMKEKVEGILEGLGQAKLVEREGTRAKAIVGGENDGKDIWEALEKEFG